MRRGLLPGTLTFSLSVPSTGPGSSSPWAENHGESVGGCTSAGTQARWPHVGPYASGSPLGAFPRSVHHVASNSLFFPCGITIPPALSVDFSRPLCDILDRAVWQVDLLPALTFAVAVCLAGGHLTSPAQLQAAQCLTSLFRHPSPLCTAGPTRQMAQILGSDRQ